MQDRPPPLVRRVHRGRMCSQGGPPVLQGAGMLRTARGSPLQGGRGAGAVLGGAPGSQQEVLRLRALAHVSRQRLQLDSLHAESGSTDLPHSCWQYGHVQAVSWWVHALDAGAGSLFVLPEVTGTAWHLGSCTRCSGAPAIIVRLLWQQTALECPPGCGWRHGSGARRPHPIPHLGQCLLGLPEARALPGPARPVAASCSGC